jgi:ankyrin repeat protein
VYCNLPDVARKGHAAVVTMLLQNGADASLASRFGDTAIDEAVDADTIAVLKAGASDASISSTRHYF